MATHTVYSHTRPDGRKFNTVTDCPYMAENIHRIADWVLSDQVSPSGINGRGLASATLYNRAGQLVCSTAQEMYFGRRRD